MFTGSWQHCQLLHLSHWLLLPSSQSIGCSHLYFKLLITNVFDIIRAVLVCEQLRRHKTTCKPLTLPDMVCAKQQVLNGHQTGDSK